MHPLKRTSSMDATIRWGGPVTATVWLFFLIQPIQSLFQSPKPLGLTLAILGPAVCVVILYLSLVLVNTYSVSDQSPSQLRLYIITLAVMTVLSFSGPLIGGIQWLPSMIYTSAAAGAKLPSKMALTTTGILVTLTTILGFLIHAPLAVMSQGVVVVGAVGLITSGVSRLIITIRALEQAREQVARLAVYEERLRVARDLHDLLGHSLSLIAVKSELAKHLVNADPDQALAEISDIERVSRSALTDVREAVSGFRQLSITRELESSKEMLSAANIHVDVKLTATDIPPKAENVLAWTIREGVTNIVRHSGARRCSISIVDTPNGVRCDIVNERNMLGTGLPTHRNGVMGNGLTGLSERVRLCNGQMDAGTTPQGAYALTVTLPLVLEN